MVFTKYKIVKWLPKTFLVLLLCCVYIKTIAPDITWANNGADGGDLITAAATGGVAHASGYPVYLLIAKLFQIIPLGSIAIRTTVLSVVSTVLAAMLIFDLTLRLFPKLQINWLIGLITAISFGLSPLVWSQTVITEVYALQLFFVTLIFYLIPLDDYKFSCEGKLLNVLRGLIFGLAMANHLTAIFLLPILGIIGILNHNKTTNNSTNKLTHRWTFNYQPFVYRFIGLLLGLSFYFVLLIRAKSGSPVNWGNPSSLSSLFWLVTGKIYSSLFLNYSHGFLFIKLKYFGNLMINQLGIFGSMIAIFGIISNWRKSIKLSLVTCWLIFAYTIFSILYNSTDSYLYLIFVNIMLAFWLGLGLAKIIDLVSLWKSWASTAISLLLLALFIFFGLLSLPKVDASKDNRAVLFGTKVMSDAPKQAIVFTDGDNDSFTLWYYHYVLKERPDIAVIVNNLLIYPWYRDILKNTYPYLFIPNWTSNSLQKSIIELNPGYPVCHTIVVDVGSIYCENN
jgi:hypothetical protein